MLRAPRIASKARRSTLGWMGAAPILRSHDACPGARRAASPPASAPGSSPALLEGRLVVQDDVLLNVEMREDALGLSILREHAHAAPESLLGLGHPHRLALQPHHPLLDPAQAVDRLAKLGSARAQHPGQPDDLAFVHTEADVLQEVAGFDAFQLQDRAGAARRRRARAMRTAGLREEGTLVAQHRVDDRVHVGPRDLAS